MQEISRRIVSAIIFSKDEKLFLGKKNPNKGGVYADCWHIPGGGVNDGETDLVALKREIKEETGIDVANCKIELVDDQGKGQSEKVLKETGEKVLCNMDFIVYKVLVYDKNSNEIKVSLDDDLEEYIWQDLKNLKSLKLTPPSVELFTKLGYI